MNNLYFELDSNFIRPVIYLHDSITNDGYRCMYDTGAIISVWCLEEGLFFKTFRYKETGIRRSVRGIEGGGRICAVYTINLYTSGILFVYIPVVLYPGATSNCQFILSHTLFKNYDVLFSKGVLSISDIDRCVRIYSIKSKDNVYYDVAIQQENLDRCPLCGGELLSTGICLNVMCSYNDLFFSNL